MVLRRVGLKIGEKPNGWEAVRGRSFYYFPVWKRVEAIVTRTCDRGRADGAVAWGTERFFGGERGKGGRGWPKSKSVDGADKPYTSLQKFNPKNK
jgi:hypothetical protein